MSPDISSAIYAGIAVIITAIFVYLGSRIHYRQKLDEAKGEIEVARRKATAANIGLDEAVRASDLKNLQLVQQQVDDLKAQAARMQAREAARDTTDQILKELVKHVGDIITRQADDTALRARQFVSLTEHSQTQADKATDKVVDQLGLAVNKVNDNTKTLFEQLVAEIHAMSDRLEAAIINKTDPTVITSVVSNDLRRLETKVDTMITEQAAAVKSAVAEALAHMQATAAPSQNVTVYPPSGSDSISTEKKE